MEEEPQLAAASLARLRGAGRADWFAAIANFYHWSSERLGKVVYLASVGLLYGSLLINLQVGNRVAVLALTMAAAVFHAVEYLSVVTRYAEAARPKARPACFSD